MTHINIQVDYLLELSEYENGELKLYETYNGDGKQITRIEYENGKEKIYCKYDEDGKIKEKSIRKSINCMASFTNK